MLVSRQDTPGASSYEAQEQLGKGSFGTVFLAEDVMQPGRRVALKTVVLRTGAGAAEVTGWHEAVAEAKLLNLVDHPHILRCHEWFEEEIKSGVGGKKLWMVLDLMDGGDLHVFYRARRQALAGPMDAPFVRKVMSSVGSALEYIHGIGMLHRDVKCANILLSRGLEGKMVLGDFGLCCAAKDAPRASDTDAAVGTPSYLSPEVICGAPHAPASDAWALGVCAFKAASLQRPFEARDEMSLTQKILKNDPPELPWSCSADVACAVLGLLNKAPPLRLTASQAVVLTHETSLARISNMSRQRPRGLRLGLLPMARMLMSRL